MNIYIFIGIIIDTFGVLRAELAEYENDLEKICFICGFELEYIERNSYGNRDFIAHIKVK